MGFVLALKLPGTVNTPPQLRHESTGCKTGSRRTVFLGGYVKQAICHFACCKAIENVYLTIAAIEFQK